jgi:hypothetical protein
LTVNDVVAVNAEVPPVAVIVLAPPVMSAIDVETATVQDPAPELAAPATDTCSGVVPVVHVKGVVVHIGVVIVTASPEPKPVTARVPVIASSGKPKLYVPVVLVNVTDGVMVYGVLTVVVPSVVTMVSAPPGRAGIWTVVLNDPAAVVVRQPVGTNPLIRLFAEPIPPVLAAKVLEHVFCDAGKNHEVVVVPEVEVMDIGALLANP